MVVPVGMTVIARHHVRRRRPLVVDPEARRQDRRRSPGYTNKTWFKIRPKAGQLPSAASAPSSAAATTRTCTARVIGVPFAEYQAWYDRQAAQIKAARRRRRQAARGAAGAADAAQQPRRRRKDPRPHGHHHRTPPRHDRSRAARPQIIDRDARPEARGWTSWITTTDHKKIGIMYLYTALVFFLLGGVEALLMRIQLAVAGQHVPDAREVQPALHDARDDDDLPGRRAGRGRASRTT